jgi:predicted Zn-dependent protease
MAENTGKKAKRPNRLNVFFGLGFRERQANGKIVLRIRWGLVCGLLVGLVAFGYLAASTAAYVYLNHFWGESQLPEDVVGTEDDVGDFSISFVEAMRLPLAKLTGGGAMREFSSRFGEWQIKKGKWLAENDEPQKARIYLMSGARRAPHDLEGRKFLAGSYLGMRQPDRAIEALEVGLQHLGNDPDEDFEYLLDYTRMLLNQRRDEKLAEFAQAQLAREDEWSARTRQMLAYAAAYATYLRGDFDAAEDLIVEHGLEKTIDGILLSSSISKDRGFPQAAIDKVEAAIDNQGNHPNFHARLTRLYMEMDKLEKARRHALERSMLDPQDIVARIHYLQILDKTGERDRALKEIRFILNNYDDNEDAMVRLAQFAAVTKDVELARRLYEKAVGRDDFDIGNFALQLIEAHITAGDYDGAIAFCEDVMAERPSWLEDKRVHFDSLWAIAAYGAGSETESERYLSSFLNDVRDERLYIPVAMRFREMGAYREARRVLKQAYERNPDNQRVLENLVSLDLETGRAEDLGEHLSKLLRLRRPPMDLIEEAYVKLASDRYIFVDNREVILIDLRALLEDRGAPQLKTTAL